MEYIESLIKNLPDSEAARRFHSEFSNKYPGKLKTLEKDEGLFSDVLTIAGFSPLLTTTILQNPEYISWLKRERKNSTIREKDEFLESLARFALTNSQVETNVLLARFRRRELIRIYLKDIRRLGTITEITEEISNLADAILEYALRIAHQQMDNRYGIPQETDKKGRSTQANFCVIALGKLGSKELNYSSDIDLLFLYSNDGSTSGRGSKGVVPNKQYFVKLSEFVSKLVGEQTGEGAAYRVDLRLRPHGRVGALAISVNEACNYYKTSAQMWERQVLIRSRSCAGNEDVFQEFYENVTPYVFSEKETAENALQNVRRSKEKINLEKKAKNGFDVKLGRGGIREIEFIAQALQLAFGGKDKWVRAPHTLISLSRLADRKYISEKELTDLFEAYYFLRRLEHRLQMEHGVQTHFLPDDLEKRLLIAQRMGVYFVADFNKELEMHTKNVDACFKRIFGEDFEKEFKEGNTASASPIQNDDYPTEDNIDLFLSSFEKSDIEEDLESEKLDVLKIFSKNAPPFYEMITANPALAEHLPTNDADFSKPNYREELLSAVNDESKYAKKLSILRKRWSRFIIEIVALDLFQSLDLKSVRTLQTELAEATIAASLEIAREELKKHFKGEFEDLPFAVLGLGKLGGGGMDYGSDLDLLLVYNDEKPCPIESLPTSVFYAKAVEYFVTVISSLTRDGSLYRVDLRLRPDGKNGATSIGKNALYAYMQERAAIWEWLAYVKLRAIAGDSDLAKSVELKTRSVIHEAASETDPAKLRNETLRIRTLLEYQKAGRRKSKEIDIKFGEGGLQDIYFAIRYLQLRDNIADDEQNRASLNSLEKLHQNGSLSQKNYQRFFEGYKFLHQLDHTLRLSIGRSTRLPTANPRALKVISRRMKLESFNDLLEKLTLHRLEIHAAFQSILKK